MKRLPFHLLLLGFLIFSNLPLYAQAQGRKPATNLAGDKNSIIKKIGNLYASLQSTKKRYKNIVTGALDDLLKATLFSLQQLKINVQNRQHFWGLKKVYEADFKTKLEYFNFRFISHCMKLNKPSTCDPLRNNFWNGPVLVYEQSLLRSIQVVDQ